MKRLATTLLLSIFFMFGFAGWAMASNVGAAVGLDSALDDLVRMIVDGFKAGHYGEAAMVTIVLAAAALRKYGSRISPKLGTGNAARVYILIGTAAATLATTGLSAANLYAAVKAAGMVLGGYSIVQMVGGWLLKRSWLPGWARAALGVAMSLFQPRGAQAITAAETVGAAAVEANPGAGIGPTGTAK